MVTAPSVRPSVRPSACCAGGRELALPGTGAGRGGHAAESLEVVLQVPAPSPAPRSCPLKDCIYTSRPRRNHVGVSSYFCGWQPEHVSFRKKCRVWCSSHLWWTCRCYRICTKYFSLSFLFWCLTEPTNDSPKSSRLYKRKGKKKNQRWKKKKSQILFMVKKYDFFFFTQVGRREGVLVLFFVFFLGFCFSHVYKRTERAWRQHLRRGGDWRRSRWGPSWASQGLSWAWEGSI